MRRPPAHRTYCRRRRARSSAAVPSDRPSPLVLTHCCAPWSARHSALFYDTPAEFLLQLRYALATTPAPLTAEERRGLSWEGATERFLGAIRNSSLGDTLPSLSDHSARWVHQAIQEGGTFGDAMRKMSGGGPIARQAWLKSPQLRDADVTEIVEQSLVHSPPGAHGRGAAAEPEAPPRA